MSMDQTPAQSLLDTLSLLQGRLSGVRVRTLEQLEHEVAGPRLVGSGLPQDLQRRMLMLAAQRQVLSQLRADAPEGDGPPTADMTVQVAQAADPMPLVEAEQDQIGSAEPLVAAGAAAALLAAAAAVAAADDEDTAPHPIPGREPDIQGGQSREATEPEEVLPAEPIAAKASFLWDTDAADQEDSLLQGPVDLDSLAASDNERTEIVSQDEVLAELRAAAARQSGGDEEATVLMPPGELGSLLAASLSDLGRPEDTEDADDDISAVPGSAEYEAAVGGPTVQFDAEPDSVDVGPISMAEPEPEPVQTVAVEEDEIDDDSGVPGAEGEVATLDDRMPPNIESDLPAFGFNDLDDESQDLGDLMIEDGESIDGETLAEAMVGREPLDSGPTDMDDMEFEVVGASLLQAEDVAALDEEVDLFSADDEDRPQQDRLNRLGGPDGPEARLLRDEFNQPIIPNLRGDLNSTAPRPAAMIQLKSDGTGAPLPMGQNLFDEEELALGPADDDELDMATSSGGGWSIGVLEPEEDYEEEEVEEAEAADSDSLVAQVGAASGLDSGDTSAVSDIDPAVVEGMLGRAYEAEEQGDLEAAAVAYSDVLDVDPQHVEAYLGRGRCNLDLGDYAAAMSDFQKAEDLDSEGPEPLVAMGELFFARKDYGRAIEFFDHAIELDATHAMARCRRGISYYYKKAYRQAFLDLQKAYTLDPEIPNIRKYVQMAIKKLERSGEA